VRCWKLWRCSSSTAGRESDGKTSGIRNPAPGQTGTYSSDFGRSHRPPCVCARDTWVRFAGKHSAHWRGARSSFPDKCTIHWVGFTRVANQLVFISFAHTHNFRSFASQERHSTQVSPGLHIACTHTGVNFSPPKVGRVSSRLAAWSLQGRWHSCAF